jgi:hypothetical protein
MEPVGAQLPALADADVVKNATLPTTTAVTRDERQSMPDRTDVLVILSPCDREASSLAAVCLMLDPPMGQLGRVRDPSPV